MPISPQGVTFRTISVKQAVILFIYLFMITCSISRIMYWFKGSAKNGENKKKNNIILKRYMSSLKVNVISILPVVCTLCRLHLYTLMIGVLPSVQSSHARLRILPVQKFIFHFQSQILLHYVTRGCKYIYAKQLLLCTLTV